MELIVTTDGIYDSNGHHADHLPNEQKLNHKSRVLILKYYDIEYIFNTNRFCDCIIPSTYFTKR